MNLSIGYVCVRVMLQTLYDYIEHALQIFHFVYCYLYEENVVGSFSELVSVRNFKTNRAVGSSSSKALKLFQDHVSQVCTCIFKTPSISICHVTT